MRVTSIRCRLLYSRRCKTTSDDLEEVKGSVLPYDYMTVARRKGAMQLSDWVEEHAVVGVHGFWRGCKATLRFGAPFHSPCVI
jgi:hypothetical protein